MTANETLTSGLGNCQRCKGDHDDLVFSRLSNPADFYVWWATCPTTAQPVLLGVFEGDSPLDRPMDLATGDLWSSWEPVTQEEVETRPIYGVSKEVAELVELGKTVKRASGDGNVP